MVPRSPYGVYDDRKPADIETYFQFGRVFWTPVLVRKWIAAGSRALSRQQVGGMMQASGRRSSVTKQSALDAQAVRRAKNGDQAAFAYLYQQYKRRIYSLCWRMLDNTDLAEDLTQEVFMCAYRRLDSFRGDSAFYTWLYTIAVNAVLMYHRKNAKERNREFPLDSMETEEREDP